MWHYAPVISAMLRDLCCQNLLQDDTTVMMRKYRSAKVYIGMHSPVPETRRCSLRKQQKVNDVQYPIKKKKKKEGWSQWRDEWAVLLTLSLGMALLRLELLHPDPGRYFANFCFPIWYQILLVDALGVNFCVRKNVGGKENGFWRGDWNDCYIHYGRRHFPPSRC